jgi:hypothetical protein
MLQKTLAAVAAVMGIALLAVGACSPNEVASPACGPTMPRHPLRAGSPRPFDPTACTSEEILDYYAACSLGSWRGTCDAYAAHHPKCFGCVHSTFDDAEWGPIVVRADLTDGFVNEGGCIAILRGDTSPKSCGAAQSRFDLCLSQACAGCPAVTAIGVEELTACFRDPNILAICEAVLPKDDRVCGALGRDDPAIACVGPGGDEPYADQIKRYARMWCSSSRGGDAGADAATAVDAGPDARADGASLQDAAGDQ